MARDSKISWTNHTVNAWIGCHKVGPECAKCYAEADNKRFKRGQWGVGTLRYKTKGAKANALKFNREAAKSGERPRIFMSSMSDFFEDHPSLSEWRKEWWEIVKNCKNIDWLILTKRTQLISSMVPDDFYDGGYSHIHLGGSVGVKSSLVRLDHLRSIKDWGGIRWTSMEPLLEDLGIINFENIKWAIVGGESTVGNDFRPMEDSWVENIERQCEEQGTTFFFKQDAARQGCHSHEFKGEVRMSLPMFRS